MTPEQIFLLVLGVLIVAIPLLAILILTLARVKLRIRVNNEGFSLSLHAIGLHFTLLEDGDEGKKQKPLARCYNPDNVLAREMKASKKAALKKARKKIKKQERKAQKKKEKAKLPKTNLQEKLELALALIKLCYRKTNGKFKIRVRALRVAVGTQDAAKTAIVYGTVAQTTAYLLELIDSQYAKLSYDRNSVCIAPDFLSERTAVEIDFFCSIAFLKGLMLYHDLMEDFRRERYKIYRKAKLRIKQEREKAAKEAKSLTDQLNELLEDLTTEDTDEKPLQKRRETSDAAE